jgi:hypothetical protein
MLNPSSFETRTALEGYSIRQANALDAFIAEEVFPSVIVSKEQVKLYQYGTENLKSYDTRKDDQAEADEGDYTVFATSKTPQPHKASQRWNPADAKDFDGPVSNVEQDAADICVERLLLAREVLMATKALTTSNYPSALTATLGAGSTWLDAAGDPEGNSATARAAVFTACGKEPNAAAMSWTTFNALRAAPYIIDRTKFTSPMMSVDVFKGLLAGWLGVGEINICKARKKTAVEGNSTQTISDVWGDEILFYVKDPGQTLKKMAYGITVMRNRLWTRSAPISHTGGGDGEIMKLTMGWNYVQEPAAVVSSADTDFIAGYLLTNTI